MVLGNNSKTWFQIPAANYSNFAYYCHKEEATSNNLTTVKLAVTYCRLFLS